VAVADLSLPYHHLACFPDEPRIRHLPGHPRAEELVAVWDATPRDANIWGSLQIGGYSNQEAVDTDPVTHAVSAAMTALEAGRLDWPVSDWVLIADWHLDITAWRALPSTGRSSARTWPRGASTARSRRCTGTPDPGRSCGLATRTPLT
jgi:hypothetical protein